MAATTSDQATTANDPFVIVPGDRRSEVAHARRAGAAGAVAAAVTLLTGFLLRGRRR
jgi:hypothetical protein